MADGSTMSSPLNGLDIIVVTGLSGSGKSVAIRALEDNGFFCIDNLPVVLIPKFIELCQGYREGIKRIALGIDLREGLFLESWPEVLAELRGRFDHVVIDSPPVLPVGDTLVLSRMANALIYAVRWEDTPRDAVTNGLKLLANAGARVTGTVLPQIDFERYTRYSYGEVGSHYKRYQGYYAE